MMFIIPAASCDLNLSLTDKGLLSSSSYFGVFASSLIWGFIGDTKGRRNVILITSYVSFLMTFLSSLVAQVWLFILLRFLNGFFIGGASAVVYAYAGEFHNNLHRPKIIAWMAGFIALGNMILPGFAWLTLPGSWSIPLTPLGLPISFRPWRLLVILYGLPSVFFATMLLFLPESPKYLFSQERTEEGLQVLRQMYRVNSGRTSEEYPVNAVIWDEPKRDKSLGIAATVWEQIAPLFRRKLVWKTFMVSALQFGIFFSSNGFMMWYPEILNRMTKELDNAEEVTMCTSFVDVSQAENVTAQLETCSDVLNTDVFVSNMIISGIYCVLYITVGSLINVAGKKNMFYVFFFICACSGIAAQEVSGLAYFQVFVTAFLCVSSCISITNTVVVDLYPTQYRAMALAISLMMGRLGAVVGSQTVGYILHSFCEITYFVFAIDHLVLIGIVFLLPSSTKKSKLIEPVV